jgi:hypothetical protein
MVKKFWVVCVLIIFTIAWSEVSYSQPTIHKLVMSPTKTEIPAGSDAVALTVKASGIGLKYNWILQGDGMLQEPTTNPAVFYSPPNQIDRESVKIIISVIVKDEHEKEATESIVLTILQAESTHSLSDKQPSSSMASTCLDVSIGGDEVAFSPIKEEGVYREWRDWGWVKFALTQARRKNANEVFAYEVRGKDEYYDLWRFEVKEGANLYWKYWPGNPNIETGSCWEKITEKIPNDLLASGVDQVVIYVLSE